MRCKIAGKKILSYLLTVTTVISLTACGDSGQAVSEKSGGVGAAKAVSGTPGELVYERYEEELNVELGRLASNHTASSMYEGDTFENNPYTRYITEKLNITFTDVIEADGDDYKKQIALATASGDLPDMFTVTDYIECVVKLCRVEK